MPTLKSWPLASTTPLVLVTIAISGAFALERRQAGLQAAENQMNQERRDPSCHVDPYGCPRNCPPHTLGIGLVSMADGSCREMTDAERKKVRAMNATGRFSKDDKAAIAEREKEQLRLEAASNARGREEAARKEAEDLEYAKHGSKDPNYQAIFAAWIEGGEVKFRPFAMEAVSEHMAIDKTKNGLQMKVACAWADKFQEETQATIFGITNDGTGDFCVHLNREGFCEEPAIMQRVRQISCKRMKTQIETFEVNGESESAGTSTDELASLARQIAGESSEKGGEAWPPKARPDAVAPKMDEKKPGKLKSLFKSLTTDVSSLLKSDPAPTNPSENYAKAMQKEMRVKEDSAISYPNFAAILAVLPKDGKFELKPFPVDPNALPAGSYNGNTGFQAKTACAWAVTNSARLIGISNGHRGSWCAQEGPEGCRRFGVTQRIRNMSCVKKIRESEELEVDSSSSQK